MNAEFQRVRPWRAPSLSPEGAALASELSWRRSLAGGGEWTIGFGLAETEPDDPVSFSLSIGGAPGMIAAPRFLLEPLLDSIGAAAALQDEMELAAILIELTLESVLQRLETQDPTLAIRLGAPRRATPAEWLPVRLACTWRGVTGQLRLDLRSDAAGRLAGALRRLPRQRVSLPHLPVVLALRLFAIDLALSAVRSLELGDVILAEGQRRNAVSVLLGERVLCHALLQDGELRVVADRGPLALGLEDSTLEAGDHPPGEEEGLGLDDLPVRLTFEMGRVTVPLQDLEAIGPGYVFELARGPDQPLDILANGRRIGRGRIVEVGGALGVQVVWLGQHA
jgi:type III secretion protein Q